MPHALTAYFFLGHLHPTTVTHDSLVADTLILTASTFVVLDRTEYTLTEEAVAFGLVGAIVDGLRLGHLTTRYR